MREGGGGGVAGGGGGGVAGGGEGGVAGGRGGGGGLRDSWRCLLMTGVGNHPQNEALHGQFPVPMRHPEEQYGPLVTGLVKKIDRWTQQLHG